MYLLRGNTTSNNIGTKGWDYLIKFLMVFACIGIGVTMLENKSLIYGNMNDKDIIMAGPVNIFNSVSVPDILTSTELTPTITTRKDNSKSLLPYIHEHFGLDLAMVIGNEQIRSNGSLLTRYNLPSEYYPGLNFSYFQPYMCYTSIKNINSPQYHLLNDSKSYTDEFGFRRHETNESQFTINQQDDFVIALGTYYKEKGTVGQRFLIVTTTGMYTAVTGDEKNDAHTDQKNMFTMHGRHKQYAGLVEFIIDRNCDRLSENIVTTGTVTNGPIEVLQGDIRYIYRID